MSGDVSTSSSYDPPSIAADLHAAMAEGLVLFAHVDEERSRVRLKPDGWCAREVVGHLVDSACANHRRFVVGQTPGLARFDGYEQEVWVSRQHYADEPWADVVALWAAYNVHLRHVMRHTSREAAAMTATAPDGSGPVSIGFLMHDYVRHLRHHLQQVRTVTGL